MYTIYKNQFMTAQIEYYDLSFQAYRKIKSMILEDILPPGKKIIQEKLAEELGISRMPLHKAFQMLESEFLVEHVPRKGIFVKEVDLQEIADSFECRAAIEGLAARKAAENITTKEIQFLYTLFSPFANDPEKADLTKYQEADIAFHNSIMQISGNRILQKLEIFKNVIVRTYQRGLIRGPVETYQEHLSIIEAMSRNDAEKSEMMMKEHFRRSRDRIIERMKKN